MDLLREIYTAKSEYKATEGKNPQVIKMCSVTHRRIKAALYPNVGTSLETLPLTYFDGMAVEMDEDRIGWEFEG